MDTSYYVPYPIPVSVRHACIICNLSANGGGQKKSKVFQSNRKRGAQSIVYDFIDSAAVETKNVSLLAVEFCSLCCAWHYTYTRLYPSWPKPIETRVQSRFPAAVLLFTFVYTGFNLVVVVVVFFSSKNHRFVPPIDTSRLMLYHGPCVVDRDIVFVLL